MARDFKVILHEGTDRAAIFMEVFGRREVNVMTPFPEWCRLSGMGEPQLCYMLDLAQLTTDERARLVGHLADKFHAHPNTVDMTIDRMGVPILASDCTVVIENPHKWID